MKKITGVAAATLTLSATLALGAAPVHAAPEPKPSQQLPPELIEQLPPRLQQAVEENWGTIGWDDKGPYIIWGWSRCRLHFFVIEEWSWAFGTGPCYF